MNRTVGHQLSQINKPLKPCRSGGNSKGKKEIFVNFSVKSRKTAEQGITI
jgi:hypothetical protein